ncbi:tyrosine-type recombinase/integrase [Tateyamaria sp. SN3-11]|uniref:tyrosine-type recombinase/integrase n=1 Tax=Tateyamaria sp. SN3-11 TaxID=3092147 RepID=UPI0039EABBB5
MSIKKRGKKFSLYKRVPKRYAGVEPRKFVWCALGTDSESEAQDKAPLVWSQMLDGWEAKLKGDTTDANQRFDAARELAAARGFRYMPVSRLADDPKQIVERVAAIGGPEDAPDLLEAEALLGGAEPPALKVSECLDLYWQLARDRIQGKSEDQIRRWKNPRIRAVNNFISVCGDKPISKITPDDMLDYRQWWLEKIEQDDLANTSANKDFTHLGDVLKTVNMMKRLGLVLPLTGLAFKESEAKQRPSFSDSWIKEKIMVEGALDGLNDQAAAIVLVMVNTGARPSELAALTAGCIHLDAEVPHISIEAVGRQLKSSNAKRVIPLCGVSLEAMKKFPYGFERYRGSSAGLSAVVNKYLRNNGLLETVGHSLYGLRHSFEDRQLAAGVDERIRRDLMGHSLNRERYGKGASLAHLQGIVQATAL